MRAARLAPLFLLLGCAGAPAIEPAALPTPIVVYVTPVPVAAPTPLVIYITPEPVVQPTPRIIYVTPAPVEAHDLTVVLTLTDSQDGIQKNADGSCSGKVVYGDIVPGMQFTVKSGAGEIVGFGALSESSIVGESCVLTGTAQRVPDLPLYSIDIGNHGAVTLSRDQLAAQGWRAELNINA